MELELHCWALWKIGSISLMHSLRQGQGQGQGHGGRKPLFELRRRMAMFTELLLQDRYCVVGTSCEKTRFSRQLYFTVGIIFFTFGEVMNLKS